MTTKRYNTVFIHTIDDSGAPQMDPKLTPLVTDFSIVAYRFSGCVIEVRDVTDAQHAEMIADPDIYEQTGGPVPQYVTAAQGKMQLSIDGQLANAEAFVNQPGTPMKCKMFWQANHDFKRRSDSLNMITAALGMNQDATEDFLRAAALIEF